MHRPPSQFLAQCDRLNMGKQVRDNIHRRDCRRTSRKSSRNATLPGAIGLMCSSPLEAWERKHYPLDLPDPVEAIKYHMDQNGLQPRDLIPFIGSRNRVHEVLNRRRPLTLKMIWRLHEGLGIPAESLIKKRAA